jgi:hypothetical protein
VSRVMYNGIISILCAVDPFSRYGFNVTKSFNDGFDVTKKKKISTDAKIMITIKVKAYGSCINSFHDYHQLGHWH